MLRRSDRLSCRIASGSLSMPGTSPQFPLHCIVKRSQFLVDDVAIETSALHLGGDRRDSLFPVARRCRSTFLDEDISHAPNLAHSLGQGEATTWQGGVQLRRSSCFMLPFPSRVRVSTNLETFGAL